MVDVYVAAGSNVQPERYLPQALHELKAQYAPLRVSPAYRNRAVGFEGPDFINLVVGFSTEESLDRVRARLQDIEARCDRPSSAAKWASRTIDLDILLYGDLVCADPGTIVPRPDLARHAYMLKPMTDLAPDVVHPTLHRTMRELWEDFDRRAHELIRVDGWQIGT
jgi:2-amino-4-hydroxy-6-hydroxymethyldihydropteridine diphosphokinase